tara:strand:+ start:1154 stop:1378 length:225 start_codon:yes stop_codon:yes gene_type:complete
MKSKFFEQMNNEQQERFEHHQQQENECPPAWVLEGFNSEEEWELDNYKDWKTWEMKDRINRSRISPEHKYYGLL